MLIASRAFDSDALRVFDEKGMTDKRALAQTGQGCAVKVRRVTQLIQDLSLRPVSDLRILDVACAEGVYSFELATRGASIVAYDARNERMNWGRDIADRHGITNIEFQTADVRKVSRETHGEFDVVLFLGILYHLDFGDAIAALHNVAGMCTGFTIIDTHISRFGPDEVRDGDRKYLGKFHREHDEQANAQQKQSNLLQSFDNDRSFWFTPQSLFSLLRDVGFTSILECHMPAEPNKLNNRRTYVAMKGEPVALATYPQINQMDEREIVSQFSKRKGLKFRLHRTANWLLSPLHVEIKSID